jgi:hypothetical protein
MGLGIKSELTTPKRTRILATQAESRAPSTNDCWMMCVISLPIGVF